MRLKIWLSLTLLGSVVTPSLVFAQPGGGGGFSRGGGGGRQMDPEALWQRMSNGADSIDINKNPQAKFLVQMSGAAVPADGILTKSAYATGMAQRAAQRGAGGPAMAPPGAAPTPVPGNGVPMVIAITGDDGKPVMVNPAPGGTGGNWNGGGGDPRGDRGGGGRGGNLWGDPEGLFRRADRNGDGKIGRDETQMLLPYFDQIDTNRDGGIDLNELKVYAATQSNASPGGGGFPGAFPGGGDPKREEQEEARPVVYRFGKLPKDFPYAALDKVEDGQVSFYEWRTAGKSIDEYQERDLNGDGFLTAEEWLRGTKTALGGGESKARSGPGAPTAGGNMGGARGGRPGGSKN